IRQPCRAIVVGLARKHLVARRGWVTIAAVSVGAHARVIPRSQKRPRRADRQVSLPLRTSRGIGVQLQRRGKGESTIGGTNVIDVAGITSCAVLGIDQMYHAVVGSWLSPALVPPVALVGAKHTGEGNLT